MASGPTARARATVANEGKAISPRDHVRQPLKLTVLGNAGRYLAPLSGGSAYLVEEGETRVLLDAGGGARDALARLGIDRLDAVVLSHFHFDHVMDLVTLRHVIPPGTPLVIPPGERHRLDALAQAYVFDGRFGESEPRVVEAGAPLHVGSLRLEFAATQHSAPSFATRIGSSFVYASDTAPCAALADLARGARLLLMHTLLPMVDAASNHARIHATAQTAGALAAGAKAERLLLSHRYHEAPDAAMREAATTHFDGVKLARDEAVYEV